MHFCPDIVVIYAGNNMTLELRHGIILLTLKYHNEGHPKSRWPAIFCFLSLPFILLRVNVISSSVSSCVTIKATT